MCVDTANTRLGIGVGDPQQTLDVNGKILMESETTIADPSTTPITKGYLSSYSAPTTKLLYGVNPLCPTGTSALMRCDSASPCNWNDASYSVGSWSKVLCGQVLTDISGDFFYVSNNHTNSQCTGTTYGGVAGVPYDTGGGVYICIFNAASCASVTAPSGTVAWIQYGNWSTTSGAHSHTFSNTGTECCFNFTSCCWPSYACHTYDTGCNSSCTPSGGGSCGGYPGSLYYSQYYTATVTQVGCY